MNISKYICLVHIRHYLNIDAVDGKENGDGAVDCHRQGEHEEPATIPERHIVMNKTSTKLFTAVTDCTVNISINQKYALEDVAKAHDALTGRATTGSTILTV